MKRPHRRVHLLMWLVIAPAALATVVLAATVLQPSDATMDAIPAAAEGGL